MTPPLTPNTPSSGVVAPRGGSAYNPPGRTHFAGDEAAIERLTEVAREKWEPLRQEGDTARQWMQRVIEAFGGKIHTVPSFEEPQDGSIIIHGQHKFDVYLPAYASPLRNAFTLAHEMGHYIMHYDHKAHIRGAPPVVFQRQGASIHEWQANWFAGALLMPRDEFTRQWKKYSSDLDGEHRVAGHFGVSRDACRVRARFLGLVVREN